MSTERCHHEYQPGHRDGWCSFPPGHPPIAHSDTLYQHGNEQTGYWWNNLFPAPCEDPVDHEPHVTTLGKWCDGLTARRVRSTAPTEVWDASCAPGGYVCAAPMPDMPDGRCGMPVESEPCDIHSAAVTA